MDKRISVQAPGDIVQLLDLLNEKPGVIPALVDWIVQNKPIYWRDRWNRIVIANNDERDAILNELAAHQEMLEAKQLPSFTWSEEVDEYWHYWMMIGEPGVDSSTFLRASIGAKSLEELSNAPGSSGPAVAQGRGRSTNTLLRQIGAIALTLVDQGGKKFQWGDKPNASQIAKAAMSAVDQISNAQRRGISDTELRESISQGIKLLTEDNLPADN